MAVLRPGDGFTITIMLREYLVCWVFDQSLPSADTLILLDLKGVDKMSFEFKLGTPFKPFEQLMGVLPEASKEHVPSAFRVSLSFFSVLIYITYIFILNRI